MNILLAKIKEKIKEHPPGIYVLFYTEMWELFGRVGITAILALYLTGTLNFSDANAFNVYSGFIALAFVTPIIGGILCDHFLGNRHAIILGGSIMAIGNILLVIPTTQMMYLGLAVIAIGNGFFLPSITPLVGYLYDKNDQGRDAGFTIFYIGRNIGYFLAPILCGIVGSYFGYNYAFILSSIGMISGILVFIKGRKHLQGHGKSPYANFSGKHKLLNINPILLIYCGTIILIPIVYFILCNNIDVYLLIITSIIVLALVLNIAYKRSKTERNHIFAILFLMIFVIIFSAFLGQGGTTLNLFIDRIINRHVFNFQIPTPTFYALDPLFMFIMGPILAMLWFNMAKRQQEPKVTTKFSLALFILALGFLVFTFAAIQASIFGHAPIYYVVIAYLLFPTAELCIMPIGLSMVTRLAPKDLGAMMVGVWMLSSAASSFLTGKISQLGRIQFHLVHLTELRHAAFIYRNAFFDSATMLAIAAIILLLCGKKLQCLMK
jgi:POT family proton-dependent oligopeptide transporter